MHLVAFGLNHQTAPLEVREKLAFPAQVLPDALASLIDTRAASEAVIVSTCNRTEIYSSSAHPDAALAWLANFHGVPLDELRPYLYQLDPAAAARH